MKISKMLISSGRQPLCVSLCALRGEGRYGSSDDKIDRHVWQETHQTWATKSD